MMSKFPSLVSLKPVLFMGLSVLFIISSLAPARGMPSISSYPPARADGNSTENEVYWVILYVVRTGEIADAARPEEFQEEPPEVSEYTRVVKPPENFDFEEMHKRWGLSCHTICSDSYGPEWDEKNRATLIENYIFDAELGKVRKRTPDDIRVEMHVGVSYDRETGELGTIYMDDNLLDVLGEGIYVEFFHTGQGFHLLDGYPKEILDELTDMSTTDPLLKYIYDLKEHKVRKATEAESRAIWERWQRRAREAMAERLPMSIESLPDNRIRAVVQWSTYSMYIETNSSVLGVKFDSANMRLFIEVSGKSGSAGALDLILPSELVPAPDEVKVYLDGNPIEFTLTPAENHYLIHVQYTHSLRTLTVNLIALPTRYEQPLTLALVALTIVMVIGAVCWFKFRR